MLHLHLHLVIWQTLLSKATYNCVADEPGIISVLLLLYEYKYDEQDTQVIAM